jgi:hypothetical protein
MCATHRTCAILWAFREKYKLWGSSSYGLLQSPVTSSRLGPSICLSTLFSNTLCLCCSLSVRDQVPDPYRQNCSSAHFKLYVFSKKLGGKRFWTKC